MCRELDDCTLITTCESLSYSCCGLPTAWGCEALGTLPNFFDNVHFMLRFYGTHRLSTTEQKEVPRNDEQIVYLAYPLPHSQHLP
jgi:hypothetical protein